MSIDKKEQELQWLGITRTQVPDFPAGLTCISERPDFLMMSPLGKIGVEVTRIHQKATLHVSRPQESERRKLAEAAQQMYSKLSDVHLEVKIYIGGTTAFNNRNIQQYASALTNLVLTGMPSENSCGWLQNNYENPIAFPYEIEAISIARFSALTRNFWFVPSGGAVQEDFIPELENVIAEKEELLLNYEPDCVAHWLIVVAENNSPSTFLDPSEATLQHFYRSSFARIFFLEAFRRKVRELHLTPMSV